MARAKLIPTSIREPARDLVDHLCQAERRGLADQMDVIIESYCQSRGIDIAAVQAAAEHERAALDPSLETGPVPAKRTA